MLLLLPNSVGASLSLTHSVGAGLSLPHMVCAGVFLMTGSQSILTNVIYCSQHLLFVTTHNIFKHLQYLVKTSNPNFSNITNTDPFTVLS